MCLATILFASQTDLYTVHPIGVKIERLVDPREASTHEEQQTPSATMTWP